MKHALKQFESMPGTYILALYNPADIRIRVGSRGLEEFPRGYYLYVGSAFGPGGIKARVGRHSKKSKSKRWHIDYLRAKTELIDVQVSYRKEKLEHQWAHTLQKVENMEVIKKFGSSDCVCDGHLFFSETTPPILQLT